MTKAQPGWCTNVLATGSMADLVDTLTHLSDGLPPGTPVGLWLPDAILTDDPQLAVAPLAACLEDLGTPLLGLNAFPINDFHQTRVKDAVYQPAWDEPARLTATLRAAEAMVALSAPESDLCLTTVPIGWPAHDVHISRAIELLHQACQALEQLGHSHDRTMALAIEPEPGCIIPTARALADFVTNTPLEDAVARGSLRVCLDACHLAVEHEDPNDAVTIMQETGIRIGRVQVSSAPEADTPAGIAAIKALDEARWMHQTSVMSGDERVMFNDLSETHHAHPTGVWRTHLHVPVHRTSFGELKTTQSWIGRLLRAVAATGQRPPVEVETYAWDVLPKSYRASTLQEDIRCELEWTHHIMQEVKW